VAACRKSTGARLGKPVVRGDGEEQSFVGQDQRFQAIVGGWHRRNDHDIQGACPQLVKDRKLRALLEGERDIGVCGQKRVEQPGYVAGAAAVGEAERDAAPVRIDDLLEVLPGSAQVDQRLLHLPTRCPNGHTPEPNQVLVGHQACLGLSVTSHVGWGGPRPRSRAGGGMACGSAILDNPRYVIRGVSGSAVSSVARPAHGVPSFRRADRGCPGGREPGTGAAGGAGCR
jgi:hypothetical protein